MNTNDARWGLVQRYLDGLASGDEARELARALEVDPQLRKAFLAYARLDANLSTSTGSQIQPAIPVVPQRRSLGLLWRPLTAAAVGMLAGCILSGSIVLAFGLPTSRDTDPRIVRIFDEGFEDPAIEPGRKFPAHAGLWSGDLSPVVDSQDGVSPLAGQGMMRLAPHPKRKFSYAQRIVDLGEFPWNPGEGVPRVEVEASFRAPPGLPVRHQIRLAAFAEEPEEVKAIWGGGELFDHVLQHVGRTVTSGPDVAGWQELTATMEVPDGARSLVISLAAATPEESAPKSNFYLDEVRARFLIQKPEGERDE